MKIAFLSGKGGTGKTLLAVNLACVSPPALYVDCDVEEPNGHLFLKPAWEREREVTVPLPRVDPALCDGCRKCVEFCAFHALAWAGGQLLVFDELCHGCGGCLLVCPRQALSETRRPVGTVRQGASGAVRVLSGFLNPGEASGIPIIRSVLSNAGTGDRTFIDCPPGSSCAVMESIRDADFCVLVAEPTRFGAHNLAMVHELVRLYGKPFGAVLNKCLPGKDPSEDYCRGQNIPILARIPFEKRLGRISSDARIAVREDGRYRALFESLKTSIEKEASRAAAGHP